MLVLVVITMQLQNHPLLLMEVSSLGCAELYPKVAHGASTYAS